MVDRDSQTGVKSRLPCACSSNFNPFFSFVFHLMDLLTLSLKFPDRDSSGFLTVFLRAPSWLLSSIDGVATNSRVSDWPTLTSNFASDWQAIVSLMKFARNSIDGFENNGPQNSPGKYELF